MATFILNPNGTGSITFTASDGGTATYEYVDSDDTSEYLYSFTNGNRIIVDLQSPSDAGVDSGDVDSINSVTLKLKGQKSPTLGSGFITVQQLGTAEDSSAISNGTDSITLSGSWVTYTGFTKTTSDGSDDWVYGDLAGLQLRVNQFRNTRFGQNQVAYLYAEVDYTAAAVAVTHNAPFFGTNF